MVINGDMVYLCGIDNNGNSWIISLNLNGGNQVPNVICKWINIGSGTEDGFTSLFIYNNIIYMCTDIKPSQIVNCSPNLLNQSPTILYQNIFYTFNSIYIYNNVIYTCGNNDNSNGIILSCNLDGSNSSILYTGGSSLSFLTISDNIIYACGTTSSSSQSLIVTYNINSKQINTQTDTGRSFSSLIIYGGYIYACGQNSGFQSCIVRYNLDLTGGTVLYTDPNGTGSKFESIQANGSNNTLYVCGSNSNSQGYIISYDLTNSNSNPVYTNPLTTGYTNILLNNNIIYVCSTAITSNISGSFQSLYTIPPPTQTIQQDSYIYVTSDGYNGPLNLYLNYTE